MSKQLSILILTCCLALFAAGCAPAPEPAQEPVPVMEEEAVEEVIPTDTSLPPTEEQKSEEADEEEPTMVEMTLTSPAFAQDEAIPLQFSCDGDDLSPELAWAGVPEGAASLVLIMDDPDAPVGTWDHWLLFDMPPDLEGLAQGSTAGTEGNNSWNRTGYGGPCPPGGTHRYFFKLYALDTTLDLPAGTAKGALEAALEGHILGQTELMGTYTR
ncbi:MAG: YbhB/YbcL family Raf kinase inhibitor-like protein [Anaerolineales bacterium]|nr:YbhB/YbcL family Raf kinase inhibitor-like protein [Anaerolineales bacterium]